MFNHFAGQQVTAVCGLTDSTNMAVIKRQLTWITLGEKVLDAVFNRGVGCHGFQTTKVTAIAAIT